MKKALLALMLCAARASAQTPAADLYSIELIPAPELQRFSGIAIIGRSESLVRGF